MGSRMNPSIGQLRLLLHRAAPAKLIGRGARRGFRRVSATKKLGAPLRGLTKRLDLTVYSNGELPGITKQAFIKRRDTKWKGKSKGRRRGVAVDAQLTAIANGRKLNENTHWLTRVAISALRAEDLRLVCGQHPVVSPTGGVATAVDLVALRGSNELILIEVKTGYDEGRLLPVTRNGRAEHMQGPLHAAIDCVTHRHLAQLAAASAMFKADLSLTRQLTTAGIQKISGLLLYVTDDDVQIISLCDWWSSKAAAIMTRVSQ